MESILRYGLPPRFLAALMKPNQKSTARLRKTLGSLFGNSGDPLNHALLPDSHVGVSSLQDCAYHWVGKTELGCMCLFAVFSLLLHPVTSVRMWVQAQASTLMAMTRAQQAWQATRRCTHMSRSQSVSTDDILWMCALLHIPAQKGPMQWHLSQCRHQA